MSIIEIAFRNVFENNKAHSIFFDSEVEYFPFGSFTP